MLSLLVAAALFALRRRLRPGFPELYLVTSAGLHVAAIHFLSNVKRLISSPTVIEHAQLERPVRSAMTDPLTGLG